MHVCITLLVNLLVEFENGEKRSVDLKKVEPEGDDFGEPQTYAAVLVVRATPLLYLSVFVIRYTCTIIVRDNYNGRPSDKLPLKTARGPPILIAAQTKWPGERALLVRSRVALIQEARRRRSGRLRPAPLRSGKGNSSVSTRRWRGYVAM